LQLLVYKVFNLKARTILACAKHFTGMLLLNLVEIIILLMGESTLQNIVFHHLKLGWLVRTFMNNELNGIPTGNKYLQRQILKEIGVLTVS
jgi:hypothetical protein